MLIQLCSRGFYFLSFIRYVAAGDSVESRVRFYVLRYMKIVVGVVKRLDAKFRRSAFDVSVK